MDDVARSWWKEHKDEFLKDLGSLVAVPSVSKYDAESKDYPYGKECKKVLEVMASIIKGYGFSSINDDNQYQMLTWKGEKDSAIGIFSHLDVVPEGPGWKYPPYELTVEDDMLIGRGTGDNKGPALAVLYALRYLKEKGWKPKNSIVHFFGVNEECGMQDIQYFTKRNAMPLFSLIPDSSFPVCYGEKGVMELDCEADMGAESALVCWKSGVASNSVPALCEAVVDICFDEAYGCLKDVSNIEIENENGKTRITAHGIAAHAAFPEGSESAQNIMCEALLKLPSLPECDVRLLKSILKLFYDYYGEGIGVPLADDISGKLTHVGGFSYIDGKKRKFVQNINIRYIITADYDKMVKDITETLAENGFSLTRIHNSAPMYVDRNLPIISRLTEICNSYFGMDMKPFVMGGGTYARKLKNAVGYGPGLPNERSVFGPDRGKGHQPDEYINMSKLENGFLVYVEALVELDKFCS